MSTVILDFFSKWERGAAKPSIEKLPAIAKLYDCSVNDLLEDLGCKPAGTKEVQSHERLWRQTEETQERPGPLTRGPEDERIDEAAFTRCHPLAERGGKSPRRFSLCPTSIILPLLDLYVNRYSRFFPAFSRNRDFDKDLHAGEGTGHPFILADGRRHNAKLRGQVPL